MLDPQKIMEEILKKQGVTSPLPSPGGSPIHINSLLDESLSKLSKGADYCLIKKDGAIQNVYIAPDMECVDLNWTDEDMILPLFRHFMVFNDSIVRFEQIYDTDPEYYFEKLKEAYPKVLPGFWPPIIRPFFEEDYQWYLQRIKAFAVHFSEREKDIRQLERFYKKIFQKQNFSFPELDCSRPLDLSPFALGCALDMVNKTDSKFASISFLAIRYLIAVAIHRGHSIKIGSKVCDAVAYALYEAQFVCAFGKEFPLNKVSYSKILKDEFFTDSKLLNETSFDKFFYLLSTTNPSFHEQMQKLLESKNSRWSPECGNAFWIYSCFYKKMISYMTEKLLVQEIKLKKEKEKPATVITEKAPEPELSELVLKKRLSEATEALSKSRQKSDELSDLLTETKNDLSEKNDLIKELQKKIAELEKDVKDTEELLLKEDLGEEEDDTSLTDDELDFLNSCRIVVVGGHNHLQKQLSDRVPNIRFIDPNCGQVDYNLIRNADIVSFITNHCSHSIYQRVKQQAKLNKKKLSHHNSNHANFICRTILNELLAD